MDGLQYFLQMASELYNPEIKSWKHTASVFKLYFNADYCNQGEPTAALMTIRYIYEANHTKFPKKIEVDYGNGIVDSYPFTNIPSLK